MRSAIGWTIACATFTSIVGCADEEPLVPGERVVVTTGVAPALFAFRDGVDAPWQTPAATGAGRFEIEVRGPYTVAVVCVDAMIAETMGRSRTLDDAREMDMPCRRPAPTPFVVTGTVLQAGWVGLGIAQDFDLLDSWSFSIPAVAGTYDLVAMTRQHMAIRRGLAVSGPTMVTPPIDVLAEGTQLLDYPVAVTNPLPDEDLEVSLDFETPSTHFNFRLLNGIEARSSILPHTALAPTDIQRVIVTARSVADQPPSATGTGIRQVARRVTPASSATFRLPPRLDTVKFEVVEGQLEGTWSHLSGFDEISLDAERGLPPPELSTVQWMEISASYLAATQVQRAVLHTDIPGYDPAWRVDLTRVYERDFWAYNTNAETRSSAFAAVWQSANGSARLDAGARPVRTARARRVLERGP
jgi:hypothetical protein